MAYAIRNGNIMGIIYEICLLNISQITVIYSWMILNKRGMKVYNQWNKQSR